jgi:hypothetical protein
MVMHTLRSFSVLAALGFAAAAYGQIAAPARGNVEHGMVVKSPSGDILGTVATVIPSETNSSDGYVVIAGARGSATPVPYSTATAHVSHDALVVDKARFLNAPKVQQYQTEDGSSTVWEKKADEYWKR